MAKATCTVDGCFKTVNARGYCPQHYWYWKQYGDPIPDPERKRKPQPLRCPRERFWEKVHRTDTCWNWTAYKNTKGYGRFAVEASRQVLAHRLAWEWENGPVPDGLELDHLCRNRACVNPDHLEPVTHTENVRRSAAARTHCRNGHPFDEGNTALSQGHRRCRTCRNAAERARYWRARVT